MTKHPLPCTVRISENINERNTRKRKCKQENINKENVSKETQELFCVHLVSFKCILVIVYVLLLSWERFKRVNNFKSEKSKADNTAKANW